MQSIYEYWRTQSSPVVVTRVPEPVYRQKEPAEMLRLAVEIIGNWEKLGANVPPVFIPDFGTVTMAKPWGGKVVKTDEGQIFIHPVSGNIDEILDIAPSANPDVELAVELYREVCKQTGRTDVRFVTTDLQGVLGTAGQVMKEDELLLAMYTDPAKVHRFLDLVCRRTIEHVRELRTRAGRLDGGVWPYIWLPDDVGIVIVEDMMPLLSPSMYKEFGLTYLKRIADALGPVFIHSCGQWIHHARTMAESGIRYLGIDFCYPYARLEEIQEHLPNLVLVPGFDSNAKGDFEDYAEFLDAMISRCKAGTRLWAPITTGTNWPHDKISRVLEKHGVEFEGFCR